MPTYINIGRDTITAAAAAQYGSGTPVLSGVHAYDWKALTDSGRASINIHAYSESKYGKNWRVLLTDLDLNGWHWFNPYKNDHTVCPVLFVPSDFYREIDAVRKAAQTLLGNVRVSRDWYKGVLGKTFAVLPAVQLLIDYAPSDHYAELSERSKEDGHRFDYLRYGKAQYEQQIKVVSPNIIYVASVYCGERPDLGAGAATSNRRFIMLPPNNCIIEANPAKYDLVNYAISHEIGHCLGLSHPDKDLENRTDSVMGGGVPGMQSVGFLDYEIEKLNESPFLK